MREKLIWAVLIFLFFLVTTTHILAQERITIRVAWWGSQIRHNKTMAVIKLFEKRYPDIKIEAVYTGWREYWDRMATYAASGNLPDVMQNEYKYFTAYNNHNLLLSLDDYVGQDLRIKDIDQTLLNSARFDGKLYGIPSGLNTYTILYDPQKFKEVGMKKPSYEWDWQEYMTICRKLHDKLGIYAATSLPMATTNITGLEHYVRQHGQVLFVNSKDLGFSERLFADFYQMDTELTKAGVFAPAEIRLENHTIENDLIVKGKTVMAAYWTNEIIAISKAAGKALKMLPFPRAKDQSRSGYFLKPSMYWAVTKDSEHPAAAVKFIDFITNDVKANEILNADRGIPISATVRKAMEPNLDTTEREMFAFIKYISTKATRIDPPPPAGFDQFIDVLDKVHYEILAGTKSPEEAYQELKEFTDDILNNQY